MKKIYYIFIFITITIIFNYHDSQGKDNNVENLIGINYQNVFEKNQESSKFYSNFIVLSYKISDILENRTILPFFECDVGYNLINKEQDWNLSLVSGLKTKFYFNTSNNIFMIIDFGIGFIGGSGKGITKSYSGFIGKYGLNFGYKNFIIRYGLNLYSDFPYKSGIEYGLIYAF